MNASDHSSFREVLPFLETLDERDLSVLLEIGAIRRYAARSVLAAEGEPADAIYMLMEGDVRLSRSQRHGIPTVMQDLHPGDVVGVIGLLDTGPYMNSAEAVSEVTALVLERERFYGLGAQGEVAIYRLVRALAPLVVQTMRSALRKSDELFEDPEEGIRMMKRVLLASTRRGG